MNESSIGISDFSQGFDTTGVATYLTEIKSECLDKAAAEVLNTTDLENACDNNWEGQAKEDFKQKLKEAATHLAEQYNILYNNLESEINKIALDMKTFDDNLL